MKIMIINGSPRNKGNTSILVDEVIKGCQGQGPVEVENIVVVRKNIKYCTGCLRCCYPNSGTGACVIKDDMAEIIDHMLSTDALIFGSPNHMGTITAPLLNFLSRMMPLFEFKTEHDAKGNKTGGEMSSRIRDKKAAIVISQGDPFFSSALVYMVLEKNCHDFGLKRIGDVLSIANLKSQTVIEKKDDLNKAFELGVKLFNGIR